MLGSCILSQPMAGRAVTLGDGVDVWFGHFQSLRLGWKPFLNVDATQRAFIKSGKVHEIMADMFRSRPGERLRNKWDEEDFGKKIAMLKVDLPLFYLNKLNTWREGASVLPGNYGRAV